MPENGSVLFKDTNITLQHMHSFIRNGGVFENGTVVTPGSQNISIVFENCNIKHSNSSYLFISLNSETGANIQLNNNIFTGKLIGRCIHASDEGATKVNSLRIMNNLFPYQYNEWGSICNFKDVRYKVIKDNFNYSA